jgi:hypothetical protein
MPRKLNRTPAVRDQDKGNSESQAVSRACFSHTLRNFPHSYFRATGVMDFFIAAKEHIER